MTLPSLKYSLLPKRSSSSPASGPGHLRHHLVGINAGRSCRMLHPDIASIDPKTASPEDLEKLLSDPMYRSLQYQIQHGVQNIKLESNKGEQQIKNVNVPEGADPEKYLQKIMAEDQKNKEREAAAEQRRKEKAHQVRSIISVTCLLLSLACSCPHARPPTHMTPQEKLKHSDPYKVLVAGAGSEKVNGVYERDGEAVRNGGRVFKGPNGFGMSFECVSGGEGWILGKTPRAFYANQTKDKVPPEKHWMEH